MAERHIYVTYVKSSKKKKHSIRLIAHSFNIHYRSFDSNLSWQSDYTNAKFSPVLPGNPGTSSIINDSHRDDRTH